MMNKKVVKIICVVLAGIMLLSVAAVLLQTLAAGNIPDTGVEDINPAVLIGAAAVCLVIIALCLLLPKLKKKKANKNDEK